MRRSVLVLVMSGAVLVAATLSSITASASSPHAPLHAASRADVPTVAGIIATAKQYLGAPYAWIGDTPAGFSCIGFATYVFRKNGFNLPYDLTQAYEDYPHVDRADLQPGDLVFFSNTVFAGLSHVAIYVGNNMMIAADNFQVGVEWDNLNDQYWTRFYTGASRPLATVPGSGAVAPAATTVATAVPANSAVANPPVQSTGSVTVSATTGNTSGETTALSSVKSGSILLAQLPQVVVHSGPGTQYMTIATVSSGTVFLVVDTPQDGWYHVAFNDAQYGWLPANAVSLAQTQVTAHSQTSQVNNAVSTPDHNSANGATNDHNSANGATNNAKAPAQQSTAQTGGYMTLDILKVRVGPSFADKQIGLLPAHTPLVVLQRQGMWDMIRLIDGSTGWVDNQYVGYSGVQLQAPTQTPAQTHVQTATPSVKKSIAVAGYWARSNYRVIMVTADALVVRALPSVSGTKITVVVHGQRLRVLSSQPGWDKILLRNGVTGWVSALWVV